MINATKKFTSVSKAHEYFQNNLLYLSEHEIIAANQAPEVLKMCMAIPTPENDAWLKAYKLILQRIYGLNGKENISDITEKIMNYYQKKQTQLFKELNSSLQHHARKLATKVYLQIGTIEYAKMEFDHIRANLIEFNINAIHEARHLRYLGYVAVFEYAIICAKHENKDKIKFEKLQSDLLKHFHDYKDALKNADLSMLRSALYSNNVIESKLHKVKKKKMLEKNSLSIANNNRKSKIVISSKSLENLYGNPTTCATQEDMECVKFPQDTQEQNVLTSLKSSFEDLSPPSPEKNLTENLANLTLKEVRKPEPLVKKARRSSSPASVNLKRTKEINPALLTQYIETKKKFVSTNSQEHRKSAHNLNVY